MSRFTMVIQLHTSPKPAQSSKWHYLTSSEVQWSDVASLSLLRNRRNILKGWAPIIGTGGRLHMKDVQLQWASTDAQQTLKRKHTYWPNVNLFLLHVELHGNVLVGHHGKPIIWSLMHFKRTTDYKNTHIKKFTSFFSYMLSFMRMFLSAIMANLIKVQML
jgi:hypothetical protein